MIDILGNEIGVGDTIAYATKSYSSPKLLIGEVLSVEPKLKVWTTGPQREVEYRDRYTSYDWTGSRQPSYPLPERSVVIRKHSEWVE